MRAGRNEGYALEGAKPSDLPSVACESPSGIEPVFSGNREGNAERVEHVGAVGDEPASELFVRAKSLRNQINPVRCGFRVAFCISGPRNQQTQGLSGHAPLGPSWFCPCSHFWQASTVRSGTTVGVAGRLAT